MGRDAGNMDLPATDPDEEQDVVGHQPTPGPDLGGEESVATSISICVRINSLQMVVFLRAGTGGIP